jgi:hypothetical protein
MEWHYYNYDRFTSASVTVPRPEKSRNLVVYATQDEVDSLKIACSLFSPDRPVRYLKVSVPLARLMDKQPGGSFIRATKLADPEGRLMRHVATAQVLSIYVDSRESSSISEFSLTFPDEAKVLAQARAYRNKHIRHLSSYRDHLAKDAVARAKPHHAMIEEVRAALGSIKKYPILQYLDSKVPQAELEHYLSSSQIAPRRAIHPRLFRLLADRKKAALTPKTEVPS